MNGAKNRTDEQLVRAARRGDRQAYDTLVRRYLRPAMALAWQYTRAVEDAEDVVQEAFHRAVRALADYNIDRPFGAWFYTIVRNVARSAISKDGRRAALAPFTALESDPPAPASPDSVIYQDLERAIEALPQMQQACVRLCDVEGFTSIEAGRMLDITEGTVRAHLHRARQQLRSKVDPKHGILP